jgi:outer membrane protein assembly factor BamA
VLHRDRYRIAVGAGKGSLHYPFFGIGSDAGTSGASVDIAQPVSAFLVEPKMRVFRQWYIGPRYHIIKSSVSLDSEDSSAGEDGSKPTPPAEDLPTLRTAALGLRLQNDTRDNRFYPRGGSFLDAKLDFYDDAFGGNRSYRGLQMAYNKYLGWGRKNVFAMHGSICAVWGAPPFYDLCLLGMSQDLRGYEIGRYRDRRFAAIQVEYRRELFWRIGGAVFVGAGEVGETFSDFNGSDIIPGGGVGLRLLLARRSHVNLRVDYAWGKSSNALYVGITEAF